MRRIVIVDPGLTRRVGHNYQMAVHLSGAFAGAGIPCRVIAHRQAAGELEPELARDAVFSQSHYATLSKDPYCGQLEDFLTGGRVFAQELAGVQGLDLQDDDMVLLPTAGPRSIWGLASYLRVRDARPLVATLFHMTEPRQASIDVGSVICAVHRMAARSLATAVGRGRILWGATNDFLGHKIGPALGAEVRTLPMPVWYPAPCPSAGNGDVAPIGEPVIAFIGHMKDNHGFDTIPEVAREIRRRWPRAKVRIHVGAIGDQIAARFGPYRALREDDVAEVIEGWVDDEAMARLYCSATVLVMPYWRGAYREMVSAVLSTAIALGKPSVVPSGTWLADEVIEGRASGVSYSGDSVPTIVDAVDAVLSNRGAFVRRATELAKPWRRNQSGDALAVALMAWQKENAGRSAGT